MADDAYLRLVFQSATEEWAAVFASKTGKLPAGWKPSREDAIVMGIWAKMYAAVRDSDGGVEGLAEIAIWRERCDRLQAEVDRLQSLVGRAGRLEVR